MLCPQKKSLTYLIDIYKYMYYVNFEVLDRKTSLKYLS